MHIGKSTKRHAKNFRISVDKCFNLVAKGCRNQHGTNCWLYPPLLQAYLAIHLNKLTNRGVSFHSFEVWNKDDKLVAGELGYAVGGAYTSLTGFSDASFAGNVQLHATGYLLRQLGFLMWDFGMHMKYKEDLGAIEIPRKEFVARLTSLRDFRPRRLQCILQEASAILANKTVEVLIYIYTYLCA